MADTDTDLTPREIQVLQLSADGMKCQEIADTIGVSEHVVRNYRRVIMDKTDSPTFIQAVATAIRRSVID